MEIVDQAERYLFIERHHLSDAIDDDLRVTAVFPRLRDTIVAGLMDAASLREQQGGQQIEATERRIGAANEELVALAEQMRSLMPIIDPDTFPLSDEHIELGAFLADPKFQLHPEEEPVWNGPAISHRQACRQGAMRLVAQARALTTALRAGSHDDDDQFLSRPDGHLLSQCRVLRYALATQHVFEGVFPVQYPASMRVPAQRPLAPHAPRAEYIGISLT